MSSNISHSKKPALTPLPPDPENLNDACAAWAGQVLARLQQETGMDDISALTELLTDLMHWSDRSGCDFEDALRLAKRQYDAQTTPPRPEDGGPD